MTLDRLNAMDREAFTQALGWIFEHSPWVAERAWASRPFRDRESLHRAMATEVERASEAERLALLRAHPDLGTRARLSDASALEQKGAGLDRLTQDELDLFTMRNNGYREKFGFPFLYAVRGAAKAAILESLEVRLKSAPQGEFTEALRQVHRIAESRLKEYLDEGN